MKIGILGTSNSILSDGWVPIFEAISAPTHQVINYSSGANSSAYGLYALDHFKILKNVDCLVIDFSMNDQNFYEKERLKFKEIESYFYHLIKRVRESNVPAVALIFFNERHLACDTFRIKDLHTSICNHFGISVIDIHNLIKNIPSYHNKSVIFGENSHLSSFFSKHIAYTVKEHCNEISKIPVVKPKMDANITNQQYYGIHLAQTNGIKGVVRRGTKLVSHDCINIQKDGLTISLPEPCDIDGIFFKASNNNGYVRFESCKNSVAKNTSLVYTKGFFLRTLRPQCRVIDKISIFPFKMDSDIICKEDQADTKPLQNDNFGFDLIGLLAKNTKNYTVEYNSKLVYNNTGINNYKKSLELFCTAIDNGINNIDIHEILYIISTETSDFQLNLSCITKAIQLSSKNPYYHKHRATLLEERNAFENAEKSLLNAINLNPSIAESHMQLSYLYNRTGNTELAIQKAHDAIAYKNDNPHFHHHLGNLLRITGDLEQAKDAQEKALSLDPSMPESHIQLSYIYTRMGNTELAIQKAQDAIALNDNNANFFHHLGTLLRKKGNLEGAKDAQEKALTLAPATPGPHMQLSYIYTQMGNIELAIQKTQDAIALKGNNPHFYHHLGTLLKKIGNIEGANEAMKKACALDPALPEI